MEYCTACSLYLGCRREGKLLAEGRWTSSPREGRIDGKVRCVGEREREREREREIGRERDRERERERERGRERERLTCVTWESFIQNQTLFEFLM